MGRLAKYNPEIVYDDGDDGGCCSDMEKHEDGEYWKVTDVIKELKVISEHPFWDDGYKLKMIQSELDIPDART